AVHDPERHAELVEYRGQRPAHRALFRPHFNAPRLKLPVVLPVGALDGVAEGGYVAPRRDLLRLARLVDDPFPGQVAGLAVACQQVADPVRVLARHAVDVALGEEPIADRPDGCRLDLSQDAPRGREDLDGLLRLPAPASGRRLRRY